MKKIALIIGHNPKSQGAVRVTDGMTEFAFYKKLAEDLKALAPDQYVILQRSPEGGYAKEIDRVYAEANALRVSGTVELHFNAAAAASASGTEVLTSGTRNSMILCNLLQDHMTTALKLKSRGVKQVTKQQRGGRSLWVGSSPAALIEPFFGSNRNDCEVIDRNYDKFVKSLHDACTTFLKRPDIK